MNTKTLFICLTILAALLCSAQGLFMNNQKSMSHKARIFAHQTVQKVANFHMAADGPEIPSDIEKDFENFIRGDKAIMQEIMTGKNFSKASADKVQKFFLNNQKFVNEMVKDFDNDPSFPQCYKNLKQSQKQKFVRILIQSMDFEKILNGVDTPLTNDDIAKIKKTINDDKELGPSVATCVSGHIEKPI